MQLKKIKKEDNGYKFTYNVGEEKVVSKVQKTKTAFLCLRECQCSQRWIKSEDSVSADYIRR